MFGEPVQQKNREDLDRADLDSEMLSSSELRKLIQREIRENLDSKLKTESRSRFSCQCNISAEISKIFSFLQETTGRKTTWQGGIFSFYPTKHKVHFESQYPISQDEATLVSHGSAVYTCEGSKIWLENYDLNYLLLSSKSITLLIAPVTPQAKKQIEFKGKNIKISELTEFYRNFFLAFNEIPCDTKK